METSKELKKHHHQLNIWQTKIRDKHNAHFEIFEALNQLDYYYTYFFLDSAVSSVGFCRAIKRGIYDGFFTTKEGYMLLTYIHNNRPSKWSSWSAFVSRNSDWFWESNDSTNRVRWIMKHVEKTKNK